MEKMRGVSKILVLLLTGCGGSGSGSHSYISNTPAPEAKIPLSVELICEDWATVQAGSYKVQNNVWGKGEVTGYKQCVGINEGDSGSVIARWTWDWLNSSTYIKGYPEIIYGKKPGHSSTTPVLPRKVGNIGAATVSFDYASTHSGRGNCAFDCWLSKDPNAEMGGSLTEVMIWLDWYGGIQPAGPFSQSTTIDGRDYDVFVGTTTSQPYIVFRVTSPLVGAGSLNLRSFLDYLKSNNQITDDHYLLSVEFGNEASNGTGDTSLYYYAVNIE